MEVGNCIGEEIFWELGDNIILVVKCSLNGECANNSLATTIAHLVRLPTPSFFDHQDTVIFNDPFYFSYWAKEAVCFVSNELRAGFF